MIQALITIRLKLHQILNEKLKISEWNYTTLVKGEIQTFENTL